jgi:putative ABC transport system permease protein
LLLRFPGILTAVGAAAIVLGLASASGPLFLSSAGNEAIEREIDALTPVEAGIVIDAYGPVTRETYRAVDVQLTQRVAAVRGLGEPVRRLLGDSVAVAGANVPGGNDAPRVRLLSRPGAVENIEILEEADVEGIYVAESMATLAELEPGDELRLRYGTSIKKVSVRGIYLDLPRAGMSEYWSPMTFEILPVQQEDAPPPPLAIGSQKVILPLLESLENNPASKWEMPLERSAMTLKEAESILRLVQAIELDARNDETSLGAAFNKINFSFGGPEFTSNFPEVVRRVEDTVLSSTGPVELLSLAGRIVALIVFAAAGVFAVQHRRVEVRLLSAQGVSPWSQGVRFGLEALIPGIAGAAAGWAAAYLLVKSIGPSSLLEAGVEREALMMALRGGALAVVLYGVVAFFGARQEAQTGSSRARAVAARFPWEVVVLALAGASYYEIVTRGEPLVSRAGEVPTVDIFLLLFPILFITGMSGVVVRAIRRALPRLRSFGDRAGPARYLATRRLAGAPVIALLLITASSIALGVLVYASVLASSNEATAVAKAHVSVGSDVASTVFIDDPERYSDVDLGFPGTLVARFGDGDIQPGDLAVDTLAIDPDSFIRTAFFDSSFASESLDELVGRLEEYDGERLTVIVVGHQEAIPDGSVYVTPRFDVAIEVVGTASAWPTLEEDRPLVVTRNDALFAASAAAGSSISEAIIAEFELWGETTPDSLVDGARANDMIIHGESVRSSEEVLDTPAFLALRWTFSYLRALGIMAGAIALAGLLLYLQTRQQAREVSYALARRMGLSRSAHRRAVALELGGMLAISLAIGSVLALASAWLIHSRLDPLPGVPPDPLFDVPSQLLTVLVPVIAVAALAGAWRVQRRADTAKVGEVLRYAA